MVKIVVCVAIYVGNAAIIPALKVREDRIDPSFVVTHDRNRLSWLPIRLEQS